MICPKCGNDYCKLIPKNEVTEIRYSLFKGIMGGVLLGPAGFLFGSTNSKGKNIDVIWVCEKCNHQFQR